MTGAGFIHPTAEIAAGARIGEGVIIWQQCVLLDGATVGDRVKLAHNVLVEGGARIGAGSTVKDNVTLYDGVTLEDDVFVGPAAVFTNVLNPRSFISRKAEFRPTVIRRGASIGAGAVILCGSTVGRYAMVGAGAVVIETIPDHAVVVGNPARRIGWASIRGHRLGDDLVCPETGEAYCETEAGLVLQSAQ